jgi:type I restriction enzyme S subunit
MISRDEIWVDIKYSEEGLKNYKRVKKWQFVIHLRSFQGWFAYSNLEWITSPAYTIIDFREKEKHSSLFWRSMFMSDNFIKRLELVTYWIRDGRSISFTDFSSLKFSIPTFEEQQKVASFLSNIDGKIENIKLNAESMKEFKRWMMQEMFI